MNDYSPPRPAGQGNEALPRPAAGRRAAFWAVLVVGALCGATAVLDMDFHWHLALGRRIVAQGFPGAEPFSHLPAGVPDRQSWLADVIMAVVERIGGLVAIRLVCAAVFAAGCLSVLRLARRRTGGPQPAKQVGGKRTGGPQPAKQVGEKSAAGIEIPLLCVGIYVALSMARLRLRPDLVTLALTPLFAELLDWPARIARGVAEPAASRSSWWQPAVVLVVSALWANLHAGALIGALLSLAQLWPIGKVRIASAVAAWAGLVCTPDGLGGLLRYAADTTRLRPLIPEWQRLWERPFAEFEPEWAVVAGVIAMAGIASVLALRASTGRRSGRRTPVAPASRPAGLAARFDPLAGQGAGATSSPASKRSVDRGSGTRSSDLLRALLGFGLAASAVRFLFALVLPALWAAPVVDALVARRARLRALVVVAILALLAFFPLSHLRDTSRGIRAAGIAFLGADPPAFPAEAAEYLERSGLSGNLAHPPGWGGYLALRLPSDRFRTAADGRITHFGADLGREWADPVNDRDRESTFRRRGIDLVVIPALQLPLFRNDQPYEPIYADSFAAVILRLDGPHHVENERILKAAARKR